MHVGSQKKAVFGEVRTGFGIWFDMRRFQYRQGFLSGDGTPPVVSRCYHCTECAMTDPCTNFIGTPILNLRLMKYQFTFSLFQITQPLPDLLPDPCSDLFTRTV